MNMVNSIQRAIDFIEDNICDDLKIETVASWAFLSSFHFQRLFSIVCGMTLGEYIRNRRLSFAGIDVETTDTKIIDIALKMVMNLQKVFLVPLPVFMECPQ